MMMVSPIPIAPSPAEEMTETIEQRIDHCGGNDGVKSALADGHKAKESSAFAISLRRQRIGQINKAKIKSDNAEQPRYERECEPSIQRKSILISQCIAA